MDARDQISGEAALYALGQLDPASSASFEHRLHSGCEVANTEAAAFQETAAVLGFSVPAHQPPPQLRARLLARIAAEANPGRVIVKADQGAWMPGPAQGVEVRMLHKKSTMLVRMAAGARLPHHHHSSSEQCLVLEGTVTDGDVTVGAGDFIFMAAGTTHNELYSEHGCTFLIAYA